jgi:hypothetical protein
MTDLTTFLRDYLAPSGIHLVLITPDPFEGSGVSGHHFGADWQAAEAWVLEGNAKGRNAYFSVNLVTSGLNNKAKKTDVIGVRCAHTDIDPPKDNPAWDKQAAFDGLVTGGAPSVVIDSGNGLQALWWLTEATDTATIEQINRGIGDRFHADHCWNVDRVLRLPGTTNWPDKKKQALGRVPVQSRLLVPFNGNTYAPASLLSAFPSAPAVESVAEELPEGPREGYTGPSDDDELIRLMLAARGGIAAMFGNKATVADLWSGDPVRIAPFFPSDSGDDFNHSNADAALCAHLAFYTGADAKRIDRLFRRSGLMRDKWDRDSYRVTTVGKAVTKCSAIYNVVKAVPLAQLPPMLPGLPAAPMLPGGTDAPALNGEILPVGDIMLLQDQINHFNGCVYVSDRHQVLTPQGGFLKPESFKATYGGYVFIMSPDMTGPSKNAFEAFTENRAYRFPKADSTMFEPQLPFGHIENRLVNVYMPDTAVVSAEGDVSPMLRHFEKLFPDERDREMIWTYLAAIVQHPGVKFQWAPFIQGAQGNGKSMIGDFLKRAVGPKYCHEPFSDDLTNKFNDWMDHRILIIVEELTLDGRYEIENNLKTWITAREVEMQAKGGKKAMRPNKSNWIIFSNFQNALPIDANQRRYAPFFTAQQTAADVRRDFPDGYFPALWEWLRNGGYAYLTHYLRTRPLHPDYNPAGKGDGAARAPVTSSTASAIGASMGRYESEIIEAVQEGTPGFLNGWISSIALKSLEERERLRISPIKRKAALESMGYFELGRSPILIMGEGMKRPTLYCTREVRDGGADVQRYIRDQGFTG